MVATLALPAQQTIQDADALEQQGRLAEAEQAWRSVAALEPRNAAAFAHLGLVLAREGNLESAVPAYRTALGLDPKLPGLQLNLGLALFKQQKFKEAVVPLKAAVAAAPADPKPATLLGMSYYALGKFSDAIPYFQSAVARSPGNLQLRTVLAQSCLWAAKYSCTMEQYDRIMAVNPDSAQADMLAGEALDGLGKSSEAITQFEAAAKASPKEPNVHFGLGYLYWKQRQYARAAAEFKLELENDPNHAQALAYLADSEIKQNDMAAAKSLLEHAVNQPDAVRLAFLDLGILYLDQGKNGPGIEMLQHAIQMDPREVDAHWRLARAYQAMGKKEEARAEFAKANELHRAADEGLVQKMAGSPVAQQP